MLFLILFGDRFLLGVHLPKSHTLGPQAVETPSQCFVWVSELAELGQCYGFRWTLKGGGASSGSWGPSSLTLFVTLGPLNQHSVSWCPQATLWQFLLEGLTLPPRLPPPRPRSSQSPGLQVPWRAVSKGRLTLLFIIYVIWCLWVSVSPSAK